VFECPTYGMTEMKEEMPMIGDLVSFSNDWRLHAISKKKDYPYGIVTSIIEVESEEIEKNDNFIGTLAFPLTFHGKLGSKANIYIVQWITDNLDFKESYRLIHEEWFYNKSFFVVSKSNYNKKE
tara:strand:- start:2157 stop:2528 length:372 start_codon:yes stop_codon:yes gene_type:complete